MHYDEYDDINDNYDCQSDVIYTFCFLTVHWNCKQIKQGVLHVEGFGNMQAGTADAAEAHSHNEILNYQH